MFEAPRVLSGGGGGATEASSASLPPKGRDAACSQQRRISRQQPKRSPRSSNAVQTPTEAESREGRARTHRQPQSSWSTEQHGVPVRGRARLCAGADGGPVTRRGRRAAGARDGRWCVCCCLDDEGEGERQTPNASDLATPARRRRTRRDRGKDQARGFLDYASAGADDRARTQKRARADSARARDAAGPSPLAPRSHLP